MVLVVQVDTEDLQEDGTVWDRGPACEPGSKLSHERGGGVTGKLGDTASRTGAEEACHCAIKGEGWALGSVLV